MREEVGGEQNTIVQWDEKWRCKLVFLCNIIKPLIAVNLQLGGRGCVITDMYDVYV